MFKISFKVKNISITDNKEDMYYMISLADSEYNDPLNYLVFQKTYDPDELEEESELSEPYIECNGESCYNCCNLLTFNNNELQFEVKGTKFLILFNDVEFNRKEFVEMMKNIFDSRLLVGSGTNGNGTD